ncbi:3-methyl-2-oxobutanoate dehydrogenase subunit beta [Thermofilum pendens]|uniref:2-oxoacid oxidoreductase (ferredoxin) n=1 Tax=Thermofilum pendens (strain DSM 2475 / Hrk 5) TaxID=368408 RepID=A1RXL9_THEPD|nr:3-methyl-2-oxobutanoate dehydrogenase subunit beta [Thermofilum pendens]ABL77949.1 thiamine pyrophosphate enzyme domain protein TPP-binding [Thermofilum pendens Hrk 5]
MSHKAFPREEYILKGHAACPGCGATLLLRHVLKALGPNTYLVIPACCTSVIAGPHPRSAFKVPVLHIAFAASAAAASGMVEALEKLGKPANVVVWAGDGGTVDIGLQALSGAAERGHNLIYICYDNEAYMNTGIQKSGSTPYKAWTTTTPTGNLSVKKDVPSIMVAHRVPYVATINPAYVNDLYYKLRKAAQIKGGLKYIHAFSPCPVGWRYDSSLTVKVARLAVETGVWVLYEVENGMFSLTGPSKALVDKSKRKPVAEYLRLQGRFSHLKEEDIAEIQRLVDEQWERIAEILREQEKG